MIKKILSPILVREVRNKIIRIDEYTTITIFVDSKVDRKLRTTSLTIEVYIVDNLKAKLLLSNNIITPKGIAIDLNRKVIKLG